MFKTDERGKYRVEERWVTAWEGRDYEPGFNVQELRVYEDGSFYVHHSDPIYISENRKLAFAHKVFIEAQKELLTAIKKPNNQE